MCATKMVVGIVKKWFGKRCDESEDSKAEESTCTVEELIDSAESVYVRENSELKNDKVFDDASQAIIERSEYWQHNNSLCEELGGEWLPPGYKGPPPCMGSTTHQAEPVCCCKRCIQLRDECDIYVQLLAPFKSPTRPPGGSRQPLEGEAPPAYCEVKPQVAATSSRRRATFGNDSKPVKVTSASARYGVTLLDDNAEVPARTYSLNSDCIVKQSGAEGSRSVRQGNEGISLKQARQVAVQASSVRSTHRGNSRSASAAAATAMLHSKHHTSSDVQHARSAVLNELFPPLITVSLDGEEGYASAQRSLSEHRKSFVSLAERNLAPPPNRTICHFDS